MPRRYIGRPRDQLQWGHGREAMDGALAASRRAWTSCFNGAMAVRPWMVAPHSAHSRLLWLQWGHGREAMDGGPWHAARGRPDMLQWGHGREAMDGYVPARVARHRQSFNGAMAVRPWMAVLSALAAAADKLQWGHGREAMDGRARRPSSAWTPSFNGAMAVRPWMVDLVDFRHARNIRFNGAMAVRPWMDRRVRGRRPAGNRFNGAMAVRPWMGRQRGERGGRELASMGPWP